MRKYLIYAIGEILLVVIGILIALKINTVNQNQQRAKLENALLAQLQFEIYEVYADIWRDAGVLAMGAQSHQYIQEFIKEDKPYRDSLCFAFHWIKMDEYVYPTSAAYSRFKEEGLDIIKNDGIRINLQTLYEGHFPRLSKNNALMPDISNTFNDYYLNAFQPNSDLSLLFDYPLANDTVSRRIYTNVAYVFPQEGNQETIGYVPINFEALKKDPKFLMLLDQTKRYRDNKIRHYSAVKSIIKEMMQQIDEELGK